MGDETYTDADPLKLIRVDPNEISHEVNGFTDVWGAVEDGHWKRSKITERERYEVFHRRFVQGVSWNELPDEITQSHGKTCVRNSKKKDTKPNESCTPRSIVCRSDQTTSRSASVSTAMER
ncbi:hypothetical protein D8S78_05960 [Natrialba swarupiae]|nr:hypothetical protein [Natrialba swarupiae]